MNRRRIEWVSCGQRTRWGNDYPIAELRTGYFLQFIPPLPEQLDYYVLIETEQGELLEAKFGDIRFIDKGGLNNV